MLRLAKLGKAFTVASRTIGGGEAGKHRAECSSRRPTTRCDFDNRAHSGAAASETAQGMLVPITLVMAVDSLGFDPGKAFPEN